MVEWVALLWCTLLAHVLGRATPAIPRRLVARLRPRLRPPSLAFARLARLRPPSPAFVRAFARLRLPSSPSPAFIAPSLHLLCVSSHDTPPAPRSPRTLPSPPPRTLHSQFGRRLPLRPPGGATGAFTLLGVVAYLGAQPPFRQLVVRMETFPLLYDQAAEPPVTPLPFPALCPSMAFPALLSYSPGHSPPERPPPDLPPHGAPPDALGLPHLLVQRRRRRRVGRPRPQGSPPPRPRP